MPLYFLVALIFAGTIATFSNWRHGIYWMIAIVLIQDPIRKLTPGAPALLVLSIMPVWVAMVLQMLSNERAVLDRFNNSHHKLYLFATLFLVSLIPSAVQSVSLGSGGFKLALMGGFSYVGSLLSLLAGFYFVRRFGDLERLIRFYCILAAVLLVGGLLQARGLFPEWAAVGTNALGMKWIRYYGGGELDLVAGFFRSPDIMGWHAAATCLLALVMAVGRVGWARLFWIGVAGWGGVSVMICGRRKAFMMLPVFALALLWVNFRGKARAGQALGILLVALVAGSAFYEQTASSEDVEGYYFEQTKEDFKERVLHYVVDSVVGTFETQGFWGAGLGTASTGARYSQTSPEQTGERPRMWQEGGLDRILGELGLVGFLFAFGFGAVLIGTLLFVSRAHSEPQFKLFVALGAFVVANAANFILSHQVFGDPFISTFFAFLVGVVLSIPRLIQEANVQAALPTVAPPGKHRRLPFGYRPQPAKQVSEPRESSSGPGVSPKGVQ